MHLLNTCISRRLLEIAEHRQRKTTIRGAQWVECQDHQPPMGSECRCLVASAAVSKGALPKVGSGTAERLPWKGKDQTSDAGVHAHRDMHSPYTRHSKEMRPGLRRFPAGPNWLLAVPSRLERASTRILAAHPHRCR